MGSELDIAQGWRNEIEPGRLIGPRIRTSGPMLDGPKPRFPSSIAIADEAKKQEIASKGTCRIPCARARCPKRG